MARFSTNRGRVPIERGSINVFEESSFMGIVSSRIVGGFAGAAVVVTGLTVGVASPASAGSDLDIPSVSRSCISDHAEAGTAWAAFNKQVDKEAKIFNKMVSTKKKPYQMTVKKATAVRKQTIANAKKIKTASARGKAISNANDVFERTVEAAAAKTNARLAKISDRVKVCEAFEKKRDKKIEAANVKYENRMGSKDNGAKSVLRLARERAENAHTERMIDVKDIYGYCMADADGDDYAEQDCKTEKEVGTLDSERELEQDLRAADEEYAATEIAAAAERRRVTGK